MKDILHFAQAWLEHCREQAEYFDLEGEDGTAEKWHEDAEEAEAAIKRQIDTDANKVDFSDLVLAITMQDCVESLNQYDENVLNDAQRECLLDNQRRFEKAMEWGVMEHIWDIVHNVGHEILEVNNMPVEDA